MVRIRYGTHRSGNAGDSSGAREDGGCQHSSEEGPPFCGHREQRKSRKSLRTISTRLSFQSGVQELRYRPSVYVEDAQVLRSEALQRALSKRLAGFTHICGLANP
jgi:hypothetical protein